MPFYADGKLRIFILNVGQADTSIIVTPKGKVIIIDAVAPDKLVNLLTQIGLPPSPENATNKEEIEELIITHPHRDHYNAANRILSAYKLSAINLAPYWCESCPGGPQYLNIINRAEKYNIPSHFVSGYNRICPDGTLNLSDPNNPILDKNLVFLELIGPSNCILEDLEQANELNPNHLSIMARLTWKKFRMVFAADAQMENWSHFDREGMLSQSCDILKAAHHGSCRGTQLERLERIDPGFVIVSSNPDSSHHLPDVIGAATFKKYEKTMKKPVALTSYTGTIKITIDNNGKKEIVHFNDKDYLKKVDLSLNETNLDKDSNPTDWQTVLDNGLARI
jgi:beta-lactamase superfamily II metal-dependent hydrolase